MANADIVKELQTELADILRFKEKDLIARPGEWGKITFDKAKNDLDRIFTITNYLNTLPLEFLPDSIMRNIITRVNQSKTPIKRIDEFTLRGNPESTRDSIVNEVLSCAEQLTIDAAQWVPFLAYQKGDVAQNIEKLKSSVDQANN